jgi:ribonuclease G
LSPWFRWKRKQQAADRQEPETAPEEQVTEQVEQEAEADAAAAEDGEPTKKRRRGSRGGRGRKKSGAAAAGDGAAVDEPAQDRPEAAKRPERATRERKPARDGGGERSQRQERRANDRRRRVQQRRAPLPKAKRELLISVDVGEQRVAILEDDRVAEVYLERPERRSIAGNIYLGTVDNVLPGMEAAFVEIGLEKNGFLYVDEIVVPELEGKRHGKKITDLISRGEQLLVQAVKDPMKTKGARLTTEISLPGRFLVLVPQGEGLGVSRRLEDAERARLKDIIKSLDPKEGGIIVRTAAEGASAEDIERDLVFLQRLWKTIQAQAKGAEAPALVYQEAELPLRIVRDLFAGDFERALIDHERTYRRIVGYLKKTSPHMLDRVIRYKEKTPLFEQAGVEAEIRSTLNRRVDLPSGGYLIFDYAEAFTVVDVNTGRFVGSRSKTSGARLEDTITKNNLEAVKEVVRQLRLRDIGGIIVIDFIDMANPKNRATVEEALRNELERDRTKTYVVEISPLGLVEMTRQNVTDGPREILTKKCPTCAGDGIVVSDTTAAMDVERRLRVLAAGSRSQAFRVEVNARTASLLAGPAGARLQEIEALTKKRFFLVGRDDVHGDHAAVLAEGKLDDLRPEGALVEDAQVEVALREVDRHDAAAAVGKVDGVDVVVAAAAKLVGRKAKVRVARVLDGVAYATLLDGPGAVGTAITFESEAEKPTRAPSRAKKVQEQQLEQEAADVVADAAVPAVAPADAEPDVDAAPDAEAAPDADAAAEVAAEGDADGEEPKKKKTRRGSRGGRNRKKKQPAVDGEDVDAAEAESAQAAEAADEEAVAPADAPAATEQSEPTRRPRQPRIHVPTADVGADGKATPRRESPQAEPTGEGAAAEPAEQLDAGGVAAGGAVEATLKKRTRRGSRGGRGRKKPAAGAVAAAGAGAAAAEGDTAFEETPELEAAAVVAPEPVPTREPEATSEPEPAPEPSPATPPADEPNGDRDYVPMSEWLDEIEA